MKPTRERFASCGATILHLGMANIAPLYQRGGNLDKELQQTYS
jgi:hypothetical protein